MSLQGTVIRAKYHRLCLKLRPLLFQHDSQLTVEMTWSSE